MPLAATICVGLGAGLLLAARAVGTPAPAPIEPPESVNGEGASREPPAAPIAGTTSRRTISADDEWPVSGADPEPPDPVALAEPPAAEPLGPVVLVEPLAVATPRATPDRPSVDEVAPPGGAARGWSRLVHGRIAYLRCEGIPVALGTPASDAASGCPRDRELEAQVWSVVDGLLDCPSAPTMPGEVDLVIDLAVGAPPEVRTRDRFAPDVVRLDAPAVLSCVAEPLSAAASTLGASRLVVSFRFRAQL